MGLQKIDSCYHNDLPTYPFSIITYQLTNDKKNLISDTRLSFDEIDPLALRVRKVDSLDKIPKIVDDQQ